MKKELNILLPIEITKRELHSKTLLAFNFASEGCCVYLGDKHNILKLTNYLSPTVYFDKGYHRGVSEQIYSELDSNNASIVSFDEENAVDFKDFQQLNLRFPNNILNRFKLIYLWGDVQYKYLEGNRPNFDKSKVFTTGHPRFDLLRRDFHSLYNDDVDKYKLKYGKYILINTNFGLGNNIKGDDFTVSNYGTRFPQINELISYQKKQISNFIDLGKKISKIDGYNVILRPHPEEDHKIYEKSFKENDNVFVVSGGSVIPWILASDLMIHHDCTTGIECAMLGLNSIAYTKDLDKDLTTDIPLRISYQYDNFGDIVTFIKNQRNMELKIDNKILDDYFNFHKSSLNSIIDTTLKNILFEETQKNNVLYYKFVTNIKDLIRKIISRENFLAKKKLEGLDSNNINLLINKYNDIYNSNIKMTKINKFLYKVYS